MGTLLYGLDNRPKRWHPLVVYAFSLWSQRGRDTTPLVDAADLNLRTEELIAGDNIPTTRSHWKLKWVPGQGLFARWRQSEMVMSADGWTEMEYCCACSEVRKEYDTTLLNNRTFDVNATSIQRRSTGANGQTQVTNGGVLTGPYGPLMTGPVAGCPRCSMDFQFAWQEHNTGAEYGVGHWLHFTTWFHIGKDVDIKAIHDNMKARSGDWHNRFSPGPAGTLPLGVGQVARISDFPDDY
ncbi:hypothetical protein PG991_015848 [Apiospora marii]|uniref:Uncharacterized protein n=1 Tax=Apiospora marii TaxID=335849 RepID=A0ABR1R0M3_9PEZI